MTPRSIAHIEEARRLNQHGGAPNAIHLTVDTFNNDLFIICGIRVWLVMITCV